MGSAAIAARSTQASDRARSVCYKTDSATTKEFTIDYCLLTIFRLIKGLLQDIGLRAKPPVSVKSSIVNIKLLIVLPGGVIGNTRVFGTRIPGSSPGRVGGTVRRFDG